MILVCSEGWKNDSSYGIKGFSICFGLEHVRNIVAGEKIETIITVVVLCALRRRPSQNLDSSYPAGRKPKGKSTKEG